MTRPQRCHAWVLALLTALPCWVSEAAEPVAMVRTLDGFDAARNVAEWKVRSGGGVDCTARFSIGVPGAEGGALAAQVSMPATATKGPRWFDMTRPLARAIEAGEADGIAIRLAVERPGRWWVTAHVVVDGKALTKPFEPIQFTSEFETRLLSFARFAGKGKRPIDPTRITAIGLGGAGTAGNVLYVDSIALYKVKTMQHAVSFRTNHPDLSLFEPGQEVELRFAIEQAAPAGATRLAYEIQDYFGTVAKKGEFPLIDGQRDYTAVFQPGAPGYYEIRAYWLTANGARQTPESCIRTVGSLPQGRGTFAVMPRSLRENRERMARLGERSFFGLHGDHSVGEGALLSDYIGAAWGISGSSRWSWDEKQRPKRLDGTAEWARTAMAEATSKAPKLTLNNLNISHDVPKWAKSETPDKAPGFADWEDFHAYFRDYVRLRKLRYGHMRHRLYDVGWETNLNRPLTGIHKPVYHPADVLELYRHAKQILDVEDPEGLLVGPCVSSYISGFDWLMPLFEGGLMDLLGGFNCHGYHTPPPERSGIVGKTRELRAQLAKHAPGRDLPLICSELGYRSQYGTTDRHKEHARWHVRTAVILKGEGFDVYMPFYSYDYPGVNSTYGICYNLDKKLKWGPQAGLSPKAAAPALAVCIDQLEGTHPISELRVFGRDIWGYVFARGDDPILCLWAVENEHQLDLPVGAVASVSVTDIMGRTTPVVVAGGLASIRVGPAPVYVHGVEPGLYLDARPMQTRILKEIFAGQESRTTVPTYAALTSAVAVGPVLATLGVGNALVLRVPTTVAPGAFPVRLTGTGIDGQPRQTVEWVLIPEPIEVLGVGPVLLGNQPGARLTIRNQGKLTEVLAVSAGVLGMARRNLDARVPGGTDLDIDIPLPGLAEADPTRQIPIRLEVRGTHMADTVLQRRLCFLSAHERTGAGTAGQLPNRASWRGPGSSGKPDTAEAAFEWDDRALYLDVRVEDDVFHQTRNDGTVWREDSLQLAFDTHPELDALYEPLASVFTKKVTQLSVAKAPNGTQVWRDRTHHEGELPTGNVGTAVKARIDRDDATHITHYRIAVLWPQLGLAAPRPGKPLGIAILVNDSDGPDTPRRGLELFSGIMNDKSHTLYGSVLLERTPEK